MNNPIPPTTSVLENIGKVPMTVTTPSGTKTFMVPMNSVDPLQASRKKLLDFYRKENFGKKPELMFLPLIKSGFLKVMRRRGKPPALVWL